MAATIDLTTVTTTRATEQVVAMLTRAGLKPHFGPDGSRPYRGAVEIRFDEGGVHGVFGVVLIGVRTGRILRGSIHYGNNSRPQKLNGYREVHPKVASLLALASQLPRRRERHDRHADADRVWIITR